MRLCVFWMLLDYLRHFKTIPDLFSWTLFLNVFPDSLMRLFQGWLRRLVTLDSSFKTCCGSLGLFQVGLRYFKPLEEVLKCLDVLEMCLEAFWKSLKHVQKIIERLWNKCRIVWIHYSFDLSVYSKKITKFVRREKRQISIFSISYHSILRGVLRNLESAWMSLRKSRSRPKES